MVEIVPNLFEFYIVPLTDFLCYLGDGERDLVGQESFSILNGKNNMVVRFVDVVVCPVQGHVLIL